jgi:hypothetical protein
MSSCRGPENPSAQARAETSRERTAQHPDDATLGPLREDEVALDIGIGIGRVGDLERRAGQAKLVPAPTRRILRGLYPQTGYPDPKPVARHETRASLPPANSIRTIWKGPPKTNPANPANPADHLRRRDRAHAVDALLGVLFLPRT